MAARGSPGREYARSQKGLTRFVPLALSAMDNLFPRDANTRFRAVVDRTMARSLENNKRSDRQEISVKDKFSGAHGAITRTRRPTSIADIHRTRTVKMSLNYSSALRIGFSPRSKVEEDLKFSNETMKCGATGRKSFASQPALSRAACERNCNGRSVTVRDGCTAPGGGLRLGDWGKNGEENEVRRAGTRICSFWQQ